MNYLLKRKDKALVHLLGLCCFIGILTSCGPDEKIQEQRRAATIEKLFRQERMRLNEEADSLCAQREEKMLEYLVDSFKNARIEELREVSPY